MKTRPKARCYKEENNDVWLTMSGNFARRLGKAYTMLDPFGTGIKRVLIYLAFT